MLALLVSQELVSRCNKNLSRMAKEAVTLPYTFMKCAQKYLIYTELKRGILGADGIVFYANTTGVLPLHEIP